MKNQHRLNVSGDRSKLIRDGQVVVNSVTLLTKKRDLRVWDIDCHSKYISLIGLDVPFDGDKGKPRVHLHATEETIKLDEAKEYPFSTVELDMKKTKGWHFTYETGRYNTRVIAYRLS